MQSAITNLERLGLIEINNSAKLTHKKLYEKFSTLDLYIELTKELERLKKDEANFGFDKVVIEQGSVKISPFGKSFRNSCL